MKKIALMLALLLVMGAAQAWAKCCPLGQRIEEMSQSDSYPEKFVGLIGDGIYRAAESPYELLYPVYDDIFNKDKYFTGLFTGLGTGVVRVVQNVVVGAVNIVSAPIPGAKGYIGVPNYKLCKPGESKGSGSQAVA